MPCVFSPLPHLSNVIFFVEKGCSLVFEHTVPTEIQQILASLSTWVRRKWPIISSTVPTLQTGFLLCSALRVRGHSGFDMCVQVSLDAPPPQGLITPTNQALHKTRGLVFEFFPHCNCSSTAPPSWFLCGAGRPLTFQKWSRFSCHNFLWAPKTPILFFAKQSYWLAPKPFGGPTKAHAVAHAGESTHEPRSFLTFCLGASLPQHIYVQADVVLHGRCHVAPHSPIAPPPPGRHGRQSIMTLKTCLRSG